MTPTQPTAFLYLLVNVDDDCGDEEDEDEDEGSYERKDPRRLPPAQALRVIVQEAALRDVGRGTAALWPTDPPLRHLVEAMKGGVVGYNLNMSLGNRKSII
jgi:hypothetical protein